MAVVPLSVSTVNVCFIMCLVKALMTVMLLYVNKLIIVLLLGVFPTLNAVTAFIFCLDSALINLLSKFA